MHEVTKPFLEKQANTHKVRALGIFSWGPFNCTTTYVPCKLQKISRFFTYKSRLFLS